MNNPDLNAALARYRAGDHASSAAMLARLLDREPDDPTLLRLRGLALTRAGCAVEALPLLARARRIAFTDPLSHLHYGIALLEAGRSARAAAAFRRATMLAPRAPETWINFAAALITLDQPKAARAAARRAVTLAPGDADAHYTLGRAALSAGDPMGACTALLAATKLRPSHADAFVSLGLAYYRLGRVESATRAMRAAMQAAPGHSLAEANLCAFLLLLGETEAVLARLRGVVERDPGCVTARLNLANALLLDRDAPEALALLDGTPPSGRDGAHWRAHRAMALLLLGRNVEATTELDAIDNPHDAEILILWRRITLAVRARDAAAAETLAARMAALADDEAAALLEHRIIGHFELARFHDARDRLGTAFGHWSRGHCLLARVQPFSREAYAQFVESSIASFNADRLRYGPRAANHDPAPLFIVGMPRSGTTLVEQILAAHPSVHGAGERTALHRLAARLAPKGAAGPPVLAALTDTVLTDEAAAFLAELHALDPAARFVTDKMPDNSRYLGFVATLLPGARVIACRRDPRDIGLSIFQHRFFGYHPYAHDLRDLGWMIGQHERLMAHWRAVLQVPMLDLALDEWIEDFPGTLAKVLGFLGLPHDAACLSFHRQKRLVRTASALQVREPVNRRGIGRWRRYSAELAPLISVLQEHGLVPRAEAALSATP